MSPIVGDIKYDKVKILYQPRNDLDEIEVHIRKKYMNIITNDEYNLLEDTNVNPSKPNWIHISPYGADNYYDCYDLSNNEDSNSEYEILDEEEIYILTITPEIGKISELIFGISNKYKYTIVWMQKSKQIFVNTFIASHIINKFIFVNDHCDADDTKTSLWNNILYDHNIYNTTNCSVINNYNFAISKCLVRGTVLSYNSNVCISRETNFKSNRIITNHINQIITENYDSLSEVSDDTDYIKTELDDNIVINKYHNNLLVNVTNIHINSYDIIFNKIKKYGTLCNNLTIVLPWIPLPMNRLLFNKKFFTKKRFIDFYNKLFELRKNNLFSKKILILGTGYNFGYYGKIYYNDDNITIGVLGSISKQPKYKDWKLAKKLKKRERLIGDMKLCSMLSSSKRVYFEYYPNETKTKVILSKENVPRNKWKFIVNWILS